MQSPSTRLVPPRLEPIFEGGRELKKLAEDMRTLRASIARNSRKPHGADIDMEVVFGHVEHILRELMHGRPWEPCTCDGRICSACGGKGWLSCKAIVRMLRSSERSEKELDHPTFQAVRRFVDLK